MTDPRTAASSIFTRGAVDLGALRDRAQAPASAAAPPSGGDTPTVPITSTATPTWPGGNGAGAGGAIIIDVTEATFQTEVLERSLTVPVVLDFWAEWCGPCKQLSPVLERLAVEADGAWALAKIDVDANQRLAQMFRVQGIPMVYAVVNGQPVDAFTGVVPEAQLRPWIEQILKIAGGAPVPAPEDPALLAADEALMAGDLDAAEREYKKILAQRPADGEAEAGLARVGLVRRTAGQDPTAVLAAAEAAPDDVTAQSLAADVELLIGRPELAYQRLIDLVRRVAGDDREKARQHLVSLFAVAGPDDPAVAAARRALASALF